MSLVGGLGSINGLAAVPCDVDLMSDAQLYSVDNPPRDLTVSSDKWSYAVSKQSDTFSYNKKDVEYCYLLGISIGATRPTGLTTLGNNEDLDKLPSHLKDKTYGCNFNEISLVQDKETYIKLFDQKYNQTSNFDELKQFFSAKDVRESFGDNTVETASQLGLPYDAEPYRSLVFNPKTQKYKNTYICKEKSIPTSAYVVLDTFENDAQPIGTGPKNFHSETPHRKLTIDKIIRYIKE